MPNIEEKKKIIKEMKSIIDSVNIKIKEIIRQLNEFMNNINTFYEINNDIVNNFDLKNRNYQNLVNIQELSVYFTTKNGKFYEFLEMPRCNYYKMS